MAYYTTVLEMLIIRWYLESQVFSQVVLVV